MRTFLTAGAALLMAAAPVYAATAASAPTVELKPGSIPRGADIAIPHMEGRVIVDGDIRIRVHARQVDLLGKSGSAYVVHTSAKDGYSKGRTLRVRPDGSTVVLSRHDATAEVALTNDGAHVVRVRTVPRERTAVRAIDARTGLVVASRTFRGRVFPLDASEGRVLLSS